MHCYHYLTIPDPESARDHPGVNPDDWPYWTGNFPDAVSVAQEATQESGCPFIVAQWVLTVDPPDAPLPSLEEYNGVRAGVDFPGTLNQRRI